MASYLVSLLLPFPWSLLSTQLPSHFCTELLGFPSHSQKTEVLRGVCKESFVSSTIPDMRADPSPTGFALMPSTPVTGPQKSQPHSPLSRLHLLFPFPRAPFHRYLSGLFLYFIQSLAPVSPCRSSMLTSYCN